MSFRASEPEEPRPRQRSWDNSELRHRLEGREVRGVDVLALQSSVVGRADQAPARRRRRSG
ncbi:MAG: hypothetical protein OEV60_04035 [Actinomycetota bacterium]|nr:hypothetical protein [Actinomycetota bacterium]MDH5223613.1 hypothetical protein [Actinomycetota bacterium]MDH5313612.1 hypothetical protein [Actinomycetota bacterium]